ncbi:hypothetical protein [Fulvivirga sedimenti]|uniref:Lipocalin-like domain-containing protein n=1 Tax=Fulvivirga sedimenti TaxID=2879465 RepID=A0A9X1HKB0_9BACT|nr:hypothetical protein [Fulvivirga sedimenti]MCA6073605.1 hypothetical protein [Fulvivirga sedimenti]
MRFARIKCLVWIGLAALSFSCSDDDNSLAPDAAYTGYFYRLTPQGRIQTSNVTLELSGNKFSGISSITHYPAICSGTFTRDQKKLEFENECVFTADFDWTYIVDGTYEISEDADNLYFIQDLGDEIYNVFRFPR